jgi:hypothetical protein
MELEYNHSNAFVVSKHVKAENKYGNTVSIILCPSMAIVMGASMHRKLACAENSGSTAYS